MMDCSEEVQPVSEEPSAQIELKKGMSIFIDVSIMCFFILIKTKISLKNQHC